MILYFTDRQLNILGHASNKLPRGLVITEDLKTEDIETGVAIFECTIHYDAKTMDTVKRCLKVGNYLLRRNGSENEFYTIIDTENDKRKRTFTIYAEDAGLDLLNEVVGPYEASEAFPIKHYIDRFAYDSGFVIGINEASDLTRKLVWEGEATAAERIASVATQFDHCEISYSFDIKGLAITNKYINIYKKRGKDIGAQLRMNKEISGIVVAESIANLATALYCTGGTPEAKEGEESVTEIPPITLQGYEYDDGNFYVDGEYLKSREALKRWSRYIWPDEPNQIKHEGHITRRYSYDTLSQKELCAHAVTELKKICEVEANYEVDIKTLPDYIQIGDRVVIIDDASGLYLSTRFLKLQTSVSDGTFKGVFGEYLLKNDGINRKVIELAEEFRKQDNKVSASINKVEKNTLTSTREEFYLSSSPAELMDGTWSTSKPAWTQGKYIWTRTYITKGNGSSYYSPDENGVCISGNTGDKGDDAIILSIDSSNGMVFKNSSSDTTLAVMIMIGERRIDTSSGIQDYFGTNAHLRWECKKKDEEIFSSISAHDPRLSDGGFRFTVRPEDINEKAVFNCILENVVTIASNQVTLLDLTDGISVEMSKDNYTFSGGVDCVLETQTTEVKVTALQGKEQTPCEIGDVVPPAGISVSINNHSTEPIMTLTVNPGLKKGGSITIPVLVGEITIKKEFSFSISFRGQDGTDGNGIVYTEIKYQAWKDGVTIPTGLWSDDPPKTTAEKPYLWSRIKLRYSDGTESVSYSVGSTPEGVMLKVQDMFSVLVTGENGTSLMEQTENGWTFNITSIQKTLSDATNRLNELSGASTEAESILNNLKDTVSDLGTKTAYISIHSDESGNPVLELGKEGNPFRVRISNTSVDFMDGASRVAYVSNKTLYIEQVVIKNELQIGVGNGFIWKRRSNGNMGLRRVKEK